MLYELRNEKKRRAVLVGARDSSMSEEDFEIGMQELKGLTKACDIDPVMNASQNISSEDPATLIGSGKVEEIKRVIEEYDIDTAIFNNSLTPTQLTNLSKKLDVEVIDRTGLILNIFAERARTKEARLQVDYAKLKYMLPRLVGLRSNLSRQGGTGGSLSNKGSGEKQIELDRRKIEKEMAHLRRELEEVEKSRNMQRSKRSNAAVPLVALVGYTNAGKSTLMNKLLDTYGSEESGRVYVENMLFATLDTTVRKLETGSGRTFLLSDTVGFINDLPTDLVNAFHSTLEEAVYADLIIEVVDASDPNHAMHSKVTDKTLSRLGAGDIPRITVMNKAELSENFTIPKIIGDKAYISAKNGIGIEELISLIEKKLNESLNFCKLLIPYDKAGIESMLREKAQIEAADYREDGIYIEAYLAPAEYGKCREFLLP
ncbi:GTPase HflX [Lachnospiraceae bacterium C1.1]|nr:GTPase HflX [Lachnospiraceae bacterium C1.1]